MKKVLLIVPPLNVRRSTIKRCCTPLGLAYIAGVLEEKGVDVQILDAHVEGYDNEQDIGNDYVKQGLSDNQIIKRIEDFNPDYVGVTCTFTNALQNIFHICNLTKEINNNIQVAIGGIHPTNYPLSVMNECDDIDYIILGEGEYRFPKLVNGERNFEGLAISKTRKIIPPIQRIENLDVLPLPARHLLQMEKYININKHISFYSKKGRVEQILTSRGCPGRCIFCTSSKFFGHKVRYRKPTSVIEEMRQLINEHGIEEFQFTDDNMTLDKKRFIELLRMMKPLNICFSMASGVYVNSLDKEIIREMLEAGCYHIAFAVESGSKDSLRRMKKNIDLPKVKPLVKYSQKLGIDCHGLFVLGIPHDTMKDVRQSVDFAKDCGFDSTSFFNASPLPGSELYDICISEGLLEDTSLNKIDFRSAKIQNPNLPPELFERMIRKENQKSIIKYLFQHPIKFWRKYGRFMTDNPREIRRML